MSFDVPTLAVMVVLVGFELAVGFVVVGWVLGRQPGLRQWTLGAVFLSAGGLIRIFHFALPDTALILLSNGMLFVGQGCAWAGTADFCGRRYSMRPLVLGIVPYLGAMGWYVVVEPSTSSRVAVYSVALAAWSFATAWIFFRHAPAELRASTRVAAWLFLLRGAFYLGRPFFPQDGQLASDLLQPGWPRILAAFEIVLSSIALFLALLVILGHRLMSQLEQAARTDALTGVLNRGAFEARASRALELSLGIGVPCATLLFDLDHFKRINDTHGHPAGDAALRHFASLVGGALRSSDIFGRYGGEEFVAVMPGAGGAEASAAAERLRSLVAAHPVVIAETTLHMTVSVGVAWGEGPALNLDHLLSQADVALYRAKAAGRDQVMEAAAA